MPGRKAGSRAKPSGKKVKEEEFLDAFHVLSMAVVDFHQCLKKARRQFHSKELADPRWNVVTLLDLSGPQTVPQIARSRKLSRQGIQSTVNLLRRDGYVEFIENPAHKKSWLIGLTPRGRTLSDELNVRERELVSNIRINVESAEMLEAASVLGSLKAFFESAQWKEAVAKSRRGA